MTSEKYSQENGLVQKAELSVNLFLLAMMMDITSQPVTKTGYSDDKTILARNFDFYQYEVQCTVNNMSEFMANGNGFRFSTTKTICIQVCRFCPRKTTNRTSRITNNDTAINVTKHHKILGMIFDDKLQCNKIHRTRKSKSNKMAEPPEMPLQTAMGYRQRRTGIKRPLRHSIQKIL
jgi:hypothetical protein